MTANGAGAYVVVVCAALLAAGCRREARPFEQLAVAARASEGANQSDLAAGAGPAPAAATANPLQDNAWAQSEGKRLFSAFNCTGCHANGGGAIGPALIDDDWIYGFAPDAIYTSIVQGRPNGMPAFRQRLADFQAWQLVSYVQSMSGQTPIDGSPGRSDHMQARPPEIVQPYQGRRRTGHR
jgi:cytochrome c oxidase cbb3-type subunit 3